MECKQPFSFGPMIHDSHPRTNEAKRRRQRCLPKIANRGAWLVVSLCHIEVLNIYFCISCNVFVTYTINLYHHKSFVLLHTASSNDPCQASRVRSRWSRIGSCQAAGGVWQTTNLGISRVSAVCRHLSKLLFDSNRLNIFKSWSFQTCEIQLLHKSPVCEFKASNPQIWTHCDLKDLVFWGFEPYFQHLSKTFSLLCWSPKHLLCEGSRTACSTEGGCEWWVAASISMVVISLPCLDSTNCFMCVMPDYTDYPTLFDGIPGLPSQCP